MSPIFQQVATYIYSHDTQLTCLVLHKKFSSSLQDIQLAYENNLKSKLEAQLEKHHLDKKTNIVFEQTTPHIVSIIQHVLKKDYDLVIKAAEDFHPNKDSKSGLKSLDMNLLRKCPCPVWLFRNTDSNKKAPSILVAIDPDSESQEAHDLSIKLLKIAQALAERLGGHCNIIACWEFENENFLRNSPFASKIDSSEIDLMVAESLDAYQKALNALISEAGIKNQTTILERGDADNVIPSYIAREQVDLLVMGTVARTGIPGFITGNTAENILQKVSCNMFAAKPSGFISPIKAY